MSNIIGQFVPDGAEHPKELVAALYDEIFDQYPADDEVDVVLVLEKHEDPEPGVTVVDFQVVRTSGDGVMPQFFDPEDNDNEVDKAPFVGTVKKIDAWVRDRLDPPHPMYWWIHKHPEGVGFRASGKDRTLNAVLSQVDISRGTHIPEPETMEIRMERTYMGFITMNRNDSSRARAEDHVPPLGDFELDYMFVEKSGTAMGECFEAVLGLEKAQEYWDALETLLPIFRQAHMEKFAGDASEQTAERFHAAMDTLTTVGDKLDREGREKLGLPLDQPFFPELPPEVQQMIDEIISGMEGGGLGKLIGGAVIGPDGVKPFGMVPPNKDEKDPFPPLFAQPEPEFPLLGGPATPSPKQPLAADHHESPAGRPDVPDIFGNDFPTIDFLD